MGRNKDLRRKIAGRQRMIQTHEEKIRRELLKPHPDESLVAYWQSEMKVWKAQVIHLNRRLERDW